MLLLNQFLDFSAVWLLASTCAMFLLGAPAAASANLIASELFPTATRPIVLSMIFLVGMVGGMCGIWVNQHWVSGVLMCLAGLVGWWLCPNAEGRSLEEINRMVTNAKPL